MAAKTWDELHTKIGTDDEFTKEIAYKGMTCESPYNSSELIMNLLGLLSDQMLSSQDVTLKSSQRTGSVLVKKLMSRRSLPLV